MKFKRHVFVCTNERPPGHPRGCCKEKNSEGLLNTLKSEAAQAKLGPSVRIQKAGCLDHCEQGAALVVYPEGIWYGDVTPEDAQEIVQSHFVRGEPVKRLQIED